MHGIFTSETILEYLNIFYLSTGQNLLSGKKLGFEIVDDIRQQTHMLKTCVHTLYTETESQLIKAETELNDLENDLQTRTLESVCKIIKNYVTSFQLQKALAEIQKLILYYVPHASTITYTLSCFMYTE